MGLSQASSDAPLAEAAGLQDNIAAPADRHGDPPRPADHAHRPGRPTQASGRPVPEIPRPSSTAQDLERVLGVSVPVVAMLAAREMPIESILRITVGTIVEFEAPFDSELTLQVADRTLGYGQAVKVGENFGLKVTRVDSLADRVEALGGER